MIETPASWQLVKWKVSARWQLRMELDKQVVLSPCRGLVLVIAGDAEVMVGSRTSLCRKEHSVSIVKLAEKF
jgi:hypothetical protein